jgi:hypothetical protein
VGDNWTEYTDTLDDEKARIRARAAPKTPIFAIVLSSLIGVALAALTAYGVIKFVKWAWLN